MIAMEFAFAAASPGLRAFTTLRGQNLGLNTDSPKNEVLAWRRQVWQAQGLRLEDSVFMRQIHSDRLAEAGRPERGRGSLSLEDALPDCDLVISREPGQLLCVGHADCLALVLANPRRGWVGAAHMGWRGASLKVAFKLAKALGGDPEEVRGGLSVCLGPCHLELSQDQYPLFAGQACASPLVDGHFKLDLWQAALGQLEAAGLKASQIEIQRECTACHPDKYYSYRRESGNTGRMMTCIGLMD
jgi:YfiH family protein